MEIEHRLEWLLGDPVKPIAEMGLGDHREPGLPVFWKSRWNEQGARIGERRIAVHVSRRQRLQLVKQWGHVVDNV